MNEEEIIVPLETRVEVLGEVFTPSDDSSDVPLEYDFIESDFPLPESEEDTEEDTEEVPEEDTEEDTEEEDTEEIGSEISTEISDPIFFSLGDEVNYSQYSFYLLGFLVVFMILSRLER